MPKVMIVGPERIADAFGTHEPGDVIEFPSEALLELATSGTKNPETGQPYCKVVTDADVAKLKPQAEA